VSLIDTISDLPAAAEGLLDEAITLRRQIHQHPELGLELPSTQATLLEALSPLGLTVKRGTTCDSITATIDGDHDGPTMLLRADMDALPLHEDAELAFRSTDPDKMHACGHDLHVSMLVGAAKLLNARRRDLHGRVLLMFQPGEEGFNGASKMIDEGLLDGVGTIDKAFAIHISTAAPTGSIALKGGTLMASADKFRIVVKGRGGHASAPHYALDPIPIACEIVVALNLMITRRVDVFDPAVLTVGQVTGGTTHNIIPETASVLGTVRCLSERTRSAVQDHLRRVAEGIAGAHGAEATVEIEPGYPVTINHDDVANEVTKVSTALFGESRVHTMPNPVMGSEDWSYVLQRVPGAMAFLGATPKGIDPRTAAPNHSNLVHFDEAAMSSGIALYAAMALNHLGPAH
jgi:amidohydrolase